MIQKRKKSGSSRANLVWSVVFHAVLIVAAFFLAAKGGLIPPKFLPITMLKPEEKKIEPAKPKAPEPKVETAKAPEPPKTASIPQPKVETAAPPPADAAPSVAPAAAVLPDLDFGDGAKEVVSASDPNTIYKSVVEQALRSHWHRPEDVADDSFTAQVQLSVDSSGALLGSTWLKGSGDPRWDASVKTALAQTRTISRPPPKGFPSTFVVKFDVERVESADTLQLSLQ